MGLEYMKSLFLIMLIALTTKTWAYTCEQEVARTYFKLIDGAKNNRSELTHFFSEKIWKLVGYFMKRITMMALFVA